MLCNAETAPITYSADVLLDERADGRQRQNMRLPRYQQFGQLRDASALRDRQIWGQRIGGGDEFADRIGARRIVRQHFVQMRAH